MTLLLALGFLVLALVSFAAEALLPSFGLLSIMGLSFFAAAVVAAWSAGPTWGAGMLVLGGLSIPLVFSLAVRLLPKTRLGRTLILADGAGLTENQIPPREEASFVGRTGMAVSPLRPAGAVELDGRRFDAMAEGDGWIERGSRVEVVRAEGLRVVVREVRV